MENKFKLIIPIFLLGLLFLVSCSKQFDEESLSQIKSFKECSELGFETNFDKNPSECRLPNGKLFLENETTNLCADDVKFCTDGSIVTRNPENNCEFYDCQIEITNPKNNKEKENEFGNICVDQCGNGICQEFVCMGSGCPCREDAVRCPVDCLEKKKNESFELNN